MTIKLFDRDIITLKHKKTGKYCIWVYKKGEEISYKEFDTMNQAKKELKHLLRLADIRESHQLISDMCGTSYNAAKLDMGL
jgi:hypothetical protein